MNVPVIDTERLRLRGHCAGDHAASHTMWSSPEVTRHILPVPSTAQQSWMRLLTYTGLWSMLGFGFWVIEDRATGAFAGEAGFAEFRRGIDPTLEGVPEVGWAIVPAMHGRGYATEAVRAAGAWGDVHLASSRTVCIITNGNDPSFGVAAKCGFRSYGSAVSNERPITLFERFR